MDRMSCTRTIWNEGTSKKVLRMDKSRIRRHAPLFFGVMSMWHQKPTVERGNTLTTPICSLSEVCWRIASCFSGTEELTTIEVFFGMTFSRPPGQCCWQQHCPRKTPTGSKTFRGPQQVKSPACCPSRGVSWTTIVKVGADFSEHLGLLLTTEIGRG